VRDGLVSVEHPNIQDHIRAPIPADVAVFELREAPWDMVDSMGEKRVGKSRLKPMATMKGGGAYGNSVIPVYQ
jgi:predicted amidohydrolase